MNGDVGMHHGKNSRNKKALLSRILAQSCHAELCRGYDCAISLIVVLRELLVSTRFLHLFHTFVLENAVTRMVSATPRVIVLHGKRACILQYLCLAHVLYNYSLVTHACMVFAHALYIQSADRVF